MFFFDGTLCDYYTGYVFSGRDGIGDDSIQLFDTIEIDGKQYTVYYTEDSTWKQTQVSNGVEATCTVSYIIDFPNDYDGLVMRFSDMKELPKSDELYDITSDYLAEAEIKEDLFFRLRIG